MGFLSEGKFRTGSDSWGALFSIRAGAYVADSEEEILDKSSSIMLSLADREREARKRILKEAPREIEDKVFRSLGILGSARILTIPQLLNLTSNIRLGADCGIVDISMEKLNTMILECMQSNIALNAPGQKPGKDELDVLRARRARDLTEQLHEGP
jgi:protein arginine kinase